MCPSLTREQISNVPGVSRTTIYRALTRSVDPRTGLRGLGCDGRRAVRGAGPGQVSLVTACLDERDLWVLALARDHHRQGRVGARVEWQRGMSETRCYPLSVRLLDCPEVAEAEPGLLAGLRALPAGRPRRRRAALAGPPGTPDFR